MPEFEKDTITRIANDLTTKRFREIKASTDSDEMHTKYEGHRKQLEKIQAKLAEIRKVKDDCINEIKKVYRDTRGFTRENITYESLNDRDVAIKFTDSIKEKAEALKAFEDKTTESELQELKESEQEEQRLKLLIDQYEKNVLPHKKIMDFQAQLIADLKNYQKSRGKINNDEFKPSLVTKLSRDKDKTEKKVKAVASTIQNLEGICPKNIADINQEIENLKKANDGFEDKIADFGANSKGNELKKLLDKYILAIQSLSKETGLSLQHDRGVIYSPPPPPASNSGGTMESDTGVELDLIGKHENHM